MGRDGWSVCPGFQLDTFLARPLVARVATAGPRVRPVWFLWEEACFWWLTGRAFRRLSRYLGAERARWDPRFTGTFDDESTRFVRLAPERLTARDLSYAV